MERGMTDKSLRVTLFKYLPIAQVHKSPFCLTVQLGVYFTLCGFFENYTVSFCLTYSHKIVLI